ncbi:UPF0102 protein [Bacteroidia bacterium]|nr:UPF0102 protein [Bacteroidia bacterium]
MLTDKAQIGANGERLAVEYLAGRGFRIAHTNWRKGRYELDIVAERDGVVHFVEVKCRKDHGLTTPEEAITPAKFAALTRAAEAYMEEHHVDGEVQFDLVAVEHLGRRWTVRYIPNAMQSHW